jgi:AraC-like DNA-binding protein
LNSRQRSRCEADVLVRTYPVRLVSGTRLRFFYEEWGQLVYPAEGTLSVETPEGTWVVPPHRAVWVPPGIEHYVTVHGNATLRSLYFRKNAILRNRCVTLGLTALARELILHVAITGPLSRRVASHRRLAGVILDQIRELPVLPVHLPQPRVESTKQAALALADWTRSADEVARAAGVSLRTLERAFKAETGLTMGTWRQQARLLEALRLLAQGLSVGDAGFRVGYGSDSAFIYAFRRAFGIAPGAFYNQSKE